MRSEEIVALVAKFGPILKAAFPNEHSRTRFDVAHALAEVAHSTTPAREAIEAAAKVADEYAQLCNEDGVLVHQRLCILAAEEIASAIRALPSNPGEPDAVETLAQKQAREVMMPRSGSAMAQPPYGQSYGAIAPAASGGEVDGQWLHPYRSRDASGSPESAGQVGHDWLTDIARSENERDPAALQIDNPRLGSDGGACILYRGTKVVAAYFVIRDPLNFSFLFRYLSTHAGNGGQSEALCITKPASTDDKGACVQSAIDKGEGEQPVSNPDELPADVIALVGAGREAWEAMLSSDAEPEATGALDKALEAFASRVCYDDDGGSLPDAHADPCTCGRDIDTIGSHAGNGGRFDPLDGKGED